MVLNRSEADDVHSTGHVDGDSGVVGSHVEDGRTTRQVIQFRRIVLVSMLKGRIHLWCPCWRSWRSSCWSRCSSNSKKEKDVILDCEYSISLSTMMAMWTEVMSFTKAGSKMVVMVKAVITE
jgi:hypothetical protein